MLISRGPFGEALPGSDINEFGGRSVMSHWGPEPIVVEHHLSFGTALLFVGVAAAFLYFIWRMSEAENELVIVEGVRE